MTDAPKVAAARIEVARTRAALIETARDLQARLQPKTLAGEAWEKAKVKGADLAEDAVDAVKKRPVAVGGVIAALAMFLAREPLKKATVKFYDVMTPLFEPRAEVPALKSKSEASNKSAAPVRRRKRTPTRTAANKMEKT